MKNTALCFGLALTFATAAAHAGIIVGPITNPANGRDYYLLAPDSWSNSEAEAEKLGGHLAVIRNKAEQRWVYSSFANYGGLRRGLWIGLHRKTPGGAFVWVDDTLVDYTDWYANEPNNTGGHEDCAQMRWDPAQPGTWNDLENNSLLSGVVEMPINEKELSGKEKELVGSWYLAGNASSACHIAATENQLFVINERNFAQRVVLAPKGVLFIAAWGLRGEIIQDRILWSNGSWWSRKSMELGSGEEVEMK